MSFSNIPPHGLAPNSLPPPAEKAPPSLAILLTTLVALGPLSTDFYLPSLPSIAQALHSTAAQTQLTLSVFLAGFGIGQLFYGPLSDRFGRRPILLLGLVIFLLSSIVCCFAPTVEVLIAARFFQAVGACAGPVLGRAVVRDVYGPVEAARALSYMGAAMALAPLFGPTLGGWLTVWFSWQANFVVLSIFSLLQILAVRHWLAESNRHLDVRATELRQIAGNFLRLTGDRLFIGLLLCNAFAYGALFAFISGSSFVFIQYYGFSPQQMGMAFGCMVSGYMVGSVLSGRMTRRFGALTLVGVGSMVGALGGAAMLAGVLLTQTMPTPLVIMVPMWFCAASIGFVMPNAAGAALGPYPTMAGAASSLMGFSQMGLAALIGVGVGHSYDGTPIPMAGAVAVSSMVGLLCYGGLVFRRRGEVRR